MKNEHSVNLKNGAIERAFALVGGNTAVICLTACISLGLTRFVGGPEVFERVFPHRFGGIDMYWGLKYKAWWCAWIVLSYVVIPTIVILILPDYELRDCNVSIRGFVSHFWIYLVLLMCMTPIIFFSAKNPAFYRYYPMYSEADRSWLDLTSWEVIYGIQFVALEFFFRGFLLGSLGRRIGSISIPICAIPYMMIHFVKPWPEAAASVVAGVILGTLAWSTNSIWGGVFLHCTVAYTMDFLALLHREHFLH